MLNRLLWAAAHGSKQAAHLATSCSSSVTACSATCLHAAENVSVGLTAWRSSQPRTHAWRSFTTSGASGGKPHSLLERAAEAQMQKLKTKADTVDNQPPSVAARIFGVLVDSVFLGAASFGVFSAYYTFAYPNTADLDKAVQDANQSLQSQPSSSAPPPAALPTPGSSPSASPSSSGTVQPAAFPPLTSAWIAVMDKYLGIRKYVEKSIKEYRDPTYDKLLPDMAPELRGRVKTLVLDLDDTLVHKEWTRQAGWKIYKRPGVQDFLLEMGGYYEIVVFTDEPHQYAEPIISKLDPHRVVMYRLYRPETQYHNGKHVRDLSKLNRDLSQILFISCNPDAYEFQPENTLKLRPWQKDTTDTTLLDLIPMLQLIATKGVRDVRDVVRSYDGEEDIPKAFKARMQQIAQQQKPKQRGLLGGLAK